MTFTLTKTRLAVAIAAVVLAAAGTALAANPFTDVPEGQWYTDAVDWAFENEITTGKTATEFDGTAGVTRYEAVTFQQRYETNVAVPARAALQDGIDDLTDDLEALPTFHRASVDDDGTLLTGTSGITSSRASEGDYFVDFGVDVSECNWTASVRWDAAILIGGDGLLTLNSVYTFDGGFILDEEEIWVQTFESDSAVEDDLAFDLLVIC